MSDVQLIHGDCLRVMPTLPAQSVQMMFADLPYGITDNAWDNEICFKSFWAGVDACLCDDSVRVLTATQPFATTIISSNKKLFRYEIIWQKSKPTNFFNAKKMPLRAHENVLVFYKKLPVYNPQKVKGKPYKVFNNGRIDSVNYGSRLSRMSRTDFCDDVGERYPTSILCIASAGKQIHRTQKPVALLEWLIKTYTNPGDTVLDPVAGSFTTAIACLRTGRKCIAIEKDADYFALGKARVEAEQMRLAIVKPADAPPPPAPNVRAPAPLSQPGLFSHLF